MTTPRTRIVLLGAGHAHLPTIRRAARVSEAGHELVVVAPGDFWYSGLATGVLAGLYPPDLDRIDVAALLGAGGGRFVRDRATSVDPETRLVHLENGESLGYDVLSVNLGSTIPRDRIPGAAEHAVPVKPVEGLVALGPALDRRILAGETIRVVVMGGGASGCEVALALDARADRGPGRIHVTLVTAEEVLPGFAAGARRRLRRILHRRGVAVWEGTPVEEVDADGVRLGEAVRVGGGGGGRGGPAADPGRAWIRRLPAELVIDATGLVPPPALARMGLPVDGEGALRVDPHLRSLADRRVFAVGDGASLEGHDLPKVGVHAVRQAPVLLHNLMATAATLAGGGSPEDAAPRLRSFEPRSRVLLILNLGDGTGLATWGPLHFAGSAAFRLKDWIDRRWLEKVRTPVPAAGEGGTPEELRPGASAASGP